MILNLSLSYLSALSALSASSFVRGVGSERYLIQLQKVRSGFNEAYKYELLNFYTKIVLEETVLLLLPLLLLLLNLPLIFIIITLCYLSTVITITE